MKRLVAMILAAGLMGCVGGKKTPKNPTPTPTTSVDLEPIRITASEGADGEISSEFYDAATLFETASDAFERGDYPTAEKRFTQLFTEFETSNLANPARYNASLAQESQEKWAEALAGYQALLAKEPTAIPTRFRMAHCLVQLERYPEALETLLVVESRADLSGQQLIELHARKSQVLYYSNDPENSAKESAHALSIYEEIKNDEELETDYYLSMAQFYDAKVLGDQGRALPIRVDDGKKAVERDLDSKAEFLLKSQASFVRVLKIANRQFATMAGYEIGLLYEDFYHQILNAPTPSELKTELEKEVYKDLLTKELRVFLEKALRIYEKNVLLGERVGLKNEFIQQSAAHLEAIKQLLEATNTPEPAPAPAPETKPSKKPGKGKKGDFPGKSNG
jgi:tetratricopeptide (TPR) repeat protein